jgi:hypothetical protein
VLTRLVHSAPRRILSQDLTKLSWVRLTWAARVLLVPKALQAPLVGLQGLKALRVSLDRQGL